jgi:hypothetical protein
MVEHRTDGAQPAPAHKWFTAGTTEPAWTEWLPARVATCRKGGCPERVADESEWCEWHLKEMDARIAELDRDERAAPTKVMPALMPSD